jgi:hypothetical protein
VLPVIAPEPRRGLAAHEAVLADLDKASGGKTLWRRVRTLAQTGRSPFPGYTLGLAGSSILFTGHSKHRNNPGG